MRALVVNAGSSSLKYQVIDTTQRNCVFKGHVERIGIEGLTHSEALERMPIDMSAAGISLAGIDVVGHRVVHGGSIFSSATQLNDEVVAEIEKLIPLAPLHNPANVTVIKDLMAKLPTVPHVAVFDTAFHMTMPAEAYTYALDSSVAAAHGVRRYGFHGSSHKYVTNEVATLLGKSKNETSAIICHIGNGASITAVRNGISIDTSMGMTPLEGLVMGTRTGDIDAGVLFHLARQANFSIDQLDELLNKRSGLLGMAGSADMREIRALAHQGNAAAQLARIVYAYRIRKYIGAYMTLLPRIDAVAFTAGVGENDAELRQLVIHPLAHLGLRVDSTLNNSPETKARIVSATDSPISIFVVPTNEELEIALESVNAIQGGS